jgi:DNA-directed RNA polymerase specialized sigma24 family protein
MNNDAVIQQLWAENETIINKSAFKLVRSARLNCVDDVDDYVQELTIAAYRSLAKWDEGKGLPVTFFAYNAMRNRLSDIHRLKKHRDRRNPTRMLHEIQVQPSHITVLTDFDKELLKMKLKNIRKLNDELREAILPGPPTEKTMILFNMIIEEWLQLYEDDLESREVS